MMGYLLFSRQLPFLHCIIEKEIYQNSVDFGFRMIPQDCSPNQLHTPYTAACEKISHVPIAMPDSQTSQLNLPCMPTVDQCLLPNGLFKQRAVPKASQGIQNLGDSIISKHGDFVDVIKFSVILAIESCPEICHTDLSSFEKPDTLPALKTDDVVEAREVLSKDVDKSCS
jgi:hypothetical protein